MCLKLSETWPRLTINDQMKRHALMEEPTERCYGGGRLSAGVRILCKRRMLWHLKGAGSQTSEGTSLSSVSSSVHQGQCDLL